MTHTDIPDEAATSPAGRGFPALLAGISAGLVAVAADYAAHAVLPVPLLPEQAGDAFLRILPLRVFSTMVRVLGPYARPLLLVGLTLAVILLTAVATVAAVRVGRGWSPLFLGAQLLLLVGAIASTATPAPLENVALEAMVFVAAASLTLWGWIRLGGRQAPELLPGRRQFLRGLLLGAVGMAALSLGYIDLRRLLQVSRVAGPLPQATEVTPVAAFYKISKNLNVDPVVEQSSWRLELPGGRRLSYADLLLQPAQELELTLECISNEVGGDLISNGVWRGPRVLDLLAPALPSSTAKYLEIEAADGYTESFPVAELTSDCLLATHLNHQPLTVEHGFPARLLFPDHYGMKQPKWVTRISLAAMDLSGYWEQRGWDEQARVKTMSRIDCPAMGDQVGAGMVAISGIAFSGARRIGAVELSWDGRPWQPAILESEFSPYSWRFWHLAAELSAGSHTVVVRARDGGGRLQSSRPVDPLPKGSDGLHSVTFDVG